MPAVATTVVVSARILRSFFGKDKRRSACFTVSDQDIPQFLSGNANGNGAMKLIYLLRRQDFDRAGVSSTNISNAQLATIHLTHFVPHCRGLEGDTLFDSGTRAGSEGLRRFDAPSRIWLQNEIRAGRIGQTGRDNRTLRGGDPGPDRAGQVPQPSLAAGVPLNAAFGDKSTLMLVAVGFAVVLFLATR